MTAIERWLAAAQADAEQRELPELKPMLQGLGSSTAVLRAAAWNERADAPAAKGADVTREGERP